MTAPRVDAHPVPAEADPRSLADLVADCDDVRRHLLDLRRGLPAQRATVVSPVTWRRAGVVIPGRAVAVVADLEPYGD